MTPGAPARPGASWAIRSLRWVAYAVAAACVGVAVILGTARATVLNEGFYRDALDRADTYNRVYNEVLVDPAVRPVTDRLLAGLPIPRAAATANVKLVLPPSTLRTMVDDQVGSTVRWLRGEGPDRLRLRVDLRPILDNIASVGQARLGDVIDATPARATSTAAEFLRELGAAVGALARGERPNVVPDIAAAGPVAGALAGDRQLLDRATGLLVEGVPGEARAEVRAQVETALRAGDVEGALVAAGPYLLAPRLGGASVDLTRLSGGPDWDLGLVLDPDVYGDRAGPLRHVRSAASLGLGPVGAAAILLGVLAIVGLWVTAPVAGADRLRSVGLALIAGAVVSAAGLYLMWVRLPGFAAPTGWPPTLVALVDDVHDRVARGVVTAWVAALAVLLVAGGLLAGHRKARLPGFVRGRLTPAAATVAVVVAIVVLLATYVTTSILAAESPVACNGHVDLCDRRYDEVTHLGTHNAMSSTEDRFITPMHDPGIVTQLNQGVRALLIDTYRWERSDQITARLAEAEFLDPMKTLIAASLNRVDPPRPGLWLCHSVCRAGAIPLVDTLDGIRGWLDTNRHEVVTMIIQDAVTPEETASAFRDAGLLPYLATPPEDPDGKWPTLGQMIRSGRRLVVFAEKADGPAPWYRNFYRYGMETPYAFRAPAEMSCVPNRGGQGKKLFLLNHFITAGGSSRKDAGVVNNERFIVDRATRCAAERGRLPNIIAVDFTTIGEALAAVDQLNRIR